QCVGELYTQGVDKDGQGQLAIDADPTLIGLAAKLTGCLPLTGSCKHACAMSAAYRPNSGGSCCLQRCAHPFRHSAGHYFAQVFGAESFFDYSNTLRRSTAFAEIKTKR
ncbi:hypothetical protein AAIH64_35380, partial [Pseudomonas aeruginosa]|uniref:hypothetical protein n=1 Tax=Pseudomonas aeruginosa TaxID=287 RepID=UPI0031B6C2A3